jgi:hypothetical protein
LESTAGMRRVSMGAAAEVPGGDRPLSMVLVSRRSRQCVGGKQAPLPDRGARGGAGARPRHSLSSRMGGDGGLIAKAPMHLFLITCSRPPLFPRAKRPRRGAPHEQQATTWCSPAVCVCTCSASRPPGARGRACAGASGSPCARCRSGSVCIYIVRSAALIMRLESAQRLLPIDGNLAPWLTPKMTSRMLSPR